MDAALPDHFERSDIQWVDAWDWLGANDQGQVREVEWGGEHYYLCYICDEPTERQMEAFCNRCRQECGHPLVRTHADHLYLSLVEARRLREAGKQIPPDHAAFSETFTLGCPA